MGVSPTCCHPVRASQVYTVMYDCYFSMKLEKKLKDIEKEDIFNIFSIGRVNNIHLITTYKQANSKPLGKMKAMP